MAENTLKVMFAAAFARLCAYLQIHLIPLVVLIAIMIIDYLTGLAQAYNSETLNSRIGITGIAKKVGYICLVCVGAAGDYLICNALIQVGITIEVSYAFGLLVTIWLIINELISILENLSKLGVPMPGFLVNLISKLKIAVEDKAKKE